MAGYSLTEDADLDFADIYGRSQQNFGAHQAEKYALKLIDAFELLAERPRAGHDISYIKPGSRRLHHESHTIYYRIGDGEVIIFRILHQSQDPLRHL